MARICEVVGGALERRLKLENVGRVRRYPSHLRLFMTHRRELLNYANGIVGDRASAEDVLQDAYLRFATAVRSKGLEEPLGYLYRIVRNIALDGQRRQTSRGVHVTAEASEGMSATDERPSPETEISDRQQLAIVREALADLPERTRIAVEMHRLEGLKTREVAAHLGVSTTLAHGLIAEGVAHCRRRLAQPAG